MTALSAAAREIRIFASPLARWRARELGVGLDAIAGSGPGGRIVAADIATAKSRPVPALARTVPANRRTPNFILSVECQADAALAALVALGTVQPIRIEHLVVRALALALRDMPEANAIWCDDGPLRSTTVDIAIGAEANAATAMPVLRDVANKGLASISREMQMLRDRAGDGTLDEKEYVGGSFAIADLGAYGVKDAIGFVEPGQGGVLAIGAIAPRMVFRDGIPETVNALSCALTFDSRIIDGAGAARLLAKFRGYIEDPMSMLL